MFQTSLTPISRMSARERLRLKFAVNDKNCKSSNERQSKRKRINYLSWIRRKSSSCSDISPQFTSFFSFESLANKPASHTIFPSPFFTFDCRTLTGDSCWSLYLNGVDSLFSVLFPVTHVRTVHWRDHFPVRSSYSISSCVPPNKSPVHPSLHCRINSRPHS